ncbi:MAG: DUF2189 domain-containing protein [Sedimenticolaceae bacterium]
MDRFEQRKIPAAGLPAVPRIPPSRIIDWLRLGWRDFRAAGWPSMLHGLLVFIVSILILQIALFYWPVLPGAVSGFVMVGPMMATGLYALSRRLEAGKVPQLEDAIAAWRTGSRRLLPFGILLVLSGAAWVVVSAALFYFFVQAQITEPLSFLRYVLVQNFTHFLLWTVLGGLGAALFFGLSVVSIPMMLERDVDTRTAMMASMHAVGENPLTMALWALFIVIATGLSVATMMLGFIVLYPVMGHASWHVYRDLIGDDASAQVGSAG